MSFSVFFDLKNKENILYILEILPGNFPYTPVLIGFYNGTGPKNLDDPLVYHRLIETMKFAYAQRAKLGDTRFVQSAAELVSKMITP